MTRRPNLARMRRQLARAAEHAAAGERRRWLQGLTPAHRAVHEQVGGVCLQCATRAFWQLAAALRASEDGRR